MFGGAKHSVVINGCLSVELSTVFHVLAWFRGFKGDEFKEMMTIFCQSDLGCGCQVFLHFRIVCRF